MNINVITYPRSGSNFLCLHLINSFDIGFDNGITKTHTEKDHGEEYAISIIRNPLDSIASIVSMRFHFLDNEELSDQIDAAIKKYESFYSYLLNKFTGDIYLCDDLTINIDKIINKIASDLNLDVLNQNSQISFIKNEENSYELVALNRKVATAFNFVPSSIALNEYEQIKKELEKYDLCKANDLYNQVKELVIF